MNYSLYIYSIYLLFVFVLHLATQVIATDFVCGQTIVGVDSSLTARLNVSMLSGDVPCKASIELAGWQPLSSSVDLSILIESWSLGSDASVEVYSGPGLAVGIATFHQPAPPFDGMMAPGADVYATVTEYPTDSLIEVLVRGPFAADAHLSLLLTVFAKNMCMPPLNTARVGVLHDGTLDEKHAINLMCTTRIEPVNALVGEEFLALFLHQVPTTIDSKLEILEGAQMVTSNPHFRYLGLVDSGGEMRRATTSTDATINWSAGNGEPALGWNATWALVRSSCPPIQTISTNEYVWDLHVTPEQPHPDLCSLVYYPTAVLADYVLLRVDEWSLAEGDRLFAWDRTGFSPILQIWDPSYAKIGNANDFSSWFELSVGSALFLQLDVMLGVAASTAERSVRVHVVAPDSRCHRTVVSDQPRGWLDEGLGPAAPLAELVVTSADRCDITFTATGDGDYLELTLAEYYSDAATPRSLFVYDGHDAEEAEPLAAFDHLADSADVGTVLYTSGARLFLSFHGPPQFRIDWKLKKRQCYRPTVALRLDEPYYVHSPGWSADPGAPPTTLPGGQCEVLLTHEYSRLDGYFFVEFELLDAKFASGDRLVAFQSLFAFDGADPGVVSFSVESGHKVAFGTLTARFLASFGATHFLSHSQSPIIRGILLRFSAAAKTGGYLLRATMRNVTCADLSSPIVVTRMPGYVTDLWGPYVVTRGDEFDVCHWQVTFEPNTYAVFHVDSLMASEADQHEYLHFVYYDSTDTSIEEESFTTMSEIGSCSSSTLSVWNASSVELAAQLLEITTTANTLDAARLTFALSYVSYTPSYCEKAPMRRLGESLVTLREVVTLPYEAGVTYVCEQHLRFEKLNGKVLLLSIEEMNLRPSDALEVYLGAPGLFDSGALLAAVTGVAAAGRTNLPIYGTYAELGDPVLDLFVRLVVDESVLSPLPSTVGDVTLAARIEPAVCVGVVPSQQKHGILHDGWYNSGKFEGTVVPGVGKTCVYTFSFDMSVKRINFTLIDLAASSTLRFYDSAIEPSLLVHEYTAPPVGPIHRDTTTIAGNFVRVEYLVPFNLPFGGGFIMEYYTCTDEVGLEACDGVNIVYDVTNRGDRHERTKCPIDYEPTNVYESRVSLDKLPVSALPERPPYTGSATVTQSGGATSGDAAPGTTTSPSYSCVPGTGGCRCLEGGECTSTDAELRCVADLCVASSAQCGAASRVDGCPCVDSDQCVSGECFRGLCSSAVMCVTGTRDCACRYAGSADGCDDGLVCSGSMCIVATDRPLVSTEILIAVAAGGVACLLICVVGICVLLSHRRRRRVLLASPQRSNSVEMGAVRVHRSRSHTGANRRSRAPTNSLGVNSSVNASGSGTSSRARSRAHSNALHKKRSGSMIALGMVGAAYQEMPVESTSDPRRNYHSFQLGKRVQPREQIAATVGTGDYQQLNLGAPSIVNNYDLAPDVASAAQYDSTLGIRSSAGAGAGDGRTSAACQGTGQYNLAPEPDYQEISLSKTRDK